MVVAVVVLVLRREEPEVLATWRCAAPARGVAAAGPGLRSMAIAPESASGRTPPSKARGSASSAGSGPFAGPGPFPGFRRGEATLGAGGGRTPESAQPRR